MASNSVPLTCSPSSTAVPAAVAKEGVRQHSWLRVDPVAFGIALVGLIGSGLVLLLPALVLAVTSGGAIGGWLVAVAGLLCYAVAGFCIASCTARNWLRQAVYLAVLLPAIVLVLQALVLIVPILVAGRELVTGPDTPGVWHLLRPELLVEGLRTVLGGGFLLFGALIHHWIERRSRHGDLPRTWEYRTRKGQVIPVVDPQRNPALLACYRILGRFFLIAGLLECVFVLPLLGGFLLYRWFRQLRLRQTTATARERLQADHRPPVLYLRTFQDDGRHPRESWLSRFSCGLGALLAPTLEQRLARVISRHGPFVAVSQPGDELPPIDIGRMEVAGEAWCDVVLDLLARPGATVLFHAGGTAAPHWEPARLGGLLRPDQLIVFLPFVVRDAGALADEQYRAFRAWAARCLPQAHLLPTLDQRAALLFFDRFWRSHQVTPTQILPERHPRRDAFRIVQSDPRFQYRPSFLLPRDAWKLTLLGTLLAILGWVYVRNVQVLADGHYRAEMPRRNEAIVRQTPPPPGPPPPVEYDGKASGYRLCLGHGWQPETTDEPGVDRSFRYGPLTHLQVHIDPEPIDTKAFLSIFLARVEHQGVKATILQRRTFSREGYHVLEVDVKVESVFETAHVFLRIWSGEEQGFRLLASTEGPEAYLRQQVLDALDSFQPPPAP
jgi:hypothetical protein